MRDFSFQEAALRYCADCGKQINPRAEICPHCGVRQYSAPGSFQKHDQGASDKSRLVALLLCLFFGWLGIHRFYVGKAGTAILMIFTFGGFGVWWLIDFILIIVGAFKDNEGEPLHAWLD